MLSAMTRAVEVLVHLNNKYALDGRDPNSYSGVLWCLGRHNRASGPERAIAAGLSPVEQPGLTPVLLLLAASEVCASGDTMTKNAGLIDFTDADQSQWYVVNDGVMGGISQSDIRRTDHQTGLFAGELSLENNGGFASVRAVVGERDLAAFEGLEIHVKGDGRTYQLRLRTNDSDDGVAYRSLFGTRPGEWRITFIPFDQFLPTFRGRTLLDSPPLDVARIQQVVFMVADKKPGPFSLEIDYVRASNERGAIER